MTVKNKVKEYISLYLFIIKSSWQRSVTQIPLKPHEKTSPLSFKDNYFIKREITLTA